MRPRKNKTPRIPKKIGRPRKTSKTRAAKILDELCEELGIANSSDLATLVGVSSVTVSLWRRSENLSTFCVSRLSKELNVNPAFLRGETTEIFFPETSEVLNAFVNALSLAECKQVLSIANFVLSSAPKK